MIELGHLDCNISHGCNMRCTSCSHSAPINERWDMSPEVLARDLAAIKPFVRFHRLQLVGGEPTLHRDIVGMIRVAKESGVGRDVSVITNGKLLPRKGSEFWQAIDMLQLSVYPTLPEEVVELAMAKGKEYGKPVYVTRFNQFHQQLRKTPNDGSHFRTCHWKSDCYTLDDGHFALCPQSLFFPKSIMGLPQHIDCLPILEGLTEEKLQAFLNRKEPLNACRICCANEMKSKPWSESKNREEWLANSTL